MVAWQRFRFPVAVAVFLCVHAGDAAAQEHQHHKKAEKAEPLPAPPTTAQLSTAGDLAEQRMHAGDCAGALDAFDAALQNSVDPQLHRDRGMCHEKLGQPFPAIDDYRLYLTQRPNAPDADAIRARVTALETQVGIVKPGEAGVSDQTGAAVTTSIGGETDLGEPTSGGTTAGQESIEKNEQLESQADASSLRRGHGLILGLVVGGRYFTSSSLGGAELGGVDLRYSFSRVSTVLVELSIGHVNGGGTVNALSGPGIMGGYEARIALNSRVSDALLLGATFRYESLSESNGYVYALLEPEGRFGYRHVFGPALGVEAVVDGGVAFASETGIASSNTTQGLVGGHVGVLIGF
jgi:Tetratricopeptide repeat